MFAFCFLAFTDLSAFGQFYPLDVVVLSGFISLPSTSEIQIPLTCTALFCDGHLSTTRRLSHPTEGDIVITPVRNTIVIVRQWCFSPG